MSEPMTSAEGITARAGAARTATGSSGCSCAEAREHLERFLDHECDGDLTERLAQHVASCEHCSRLADAEVHLREILRSRCAEQAPAELRARVLTRLSVMRTATTVSTVSASGRTTTVSATEVRWSQR